MTPVIRFLDAVARDNENPDGSRVLVDLVDNRARAVPIMRLSDSDSFRYQDPPPPLPPGDRLVSIQYRKPARLVTPSEKVLPLEVPARPAR